MDRQWKTHRVDFDKQSKNMLRYIQEWDRSKGVFQRFYNFFAFGFLHLCFHDSLCFVCDLRPFRSSRRWGLHQSSTASFAMVGQEEHQHGTYLQIAQPLFESSIFWSSYLWSLRHIWLYISQLWGRRPWGVATLESMLQVFLKRKCGGSLLAAWRRHLDRHASMSVTWK